MKAKAKKKVKKKTKGSKKTASSKSKPKAKKKSSKPLKSKPKKSKKLKKKTKKTAVVKKKSSASSRSSAPSAPSASSASSASSAPKKRGRPKGSKNKIQKPKVAKKPSGKKRGRPKGSTNKPKVIDKSWSVGKLLGYCACGFMVAGNDRVTVNIIVCKGCGKRQRISKLNDGINSSTKHTNKKSYLEDTSTAEFHDMPAEHSGIELKIGDST